MVGFRILFGLTGLSGIRLGVGIVSVFGAEMASCGVTGFNTPDGGDARSTVSGLVSCLPVNSGAGGKAGAVGFSGTCREGSSGTSFARASDGCSAVLRSLVGLVAVGFFCQPFCSNLRPVCRSGLTWWPLGGLAGSARYLSSSSFACLHQIKLVCSRAFWVPRL